MANQEIKGKIEDQDKRHALVVKRFVIDTAYYGKISQALESSTKEHDITKEKLARALRDIEDEKRRQILVKNQRDARAKVLATEWEAEKAKIIAERDHYLAERDHYFRQMKIHQKEIGRLQQENTELRFAVKFTRMVDDAEPSGGPPSV
jgi:septal ring factor EnvC (AmiA/AmiB activator)